MATTCSFGRNKDLRLQSLCVGGLIVIDDVPNLKNINKASVRYLTVKKDATVKNLLVKEDASICGTLEVNQLVGKGEGGNLDFMCGTLSNIEGIVVNNIFSKGLSVGGNTLDNVVAFRDGCIVAFPSTGGGYRNQFWGYQSGYEASGSSDNTTMGYRSARNITTGKNNVTIGSNALSSALTTSDSVIIGQDASVLSIDPGKNVIIGANARSSFVNSYGAEDYGAHEVIIGHQAAANLVYHYDSGGTDTGSVIIGSNAALYRSTDGQSVIIGSNALKYSSFPFGEAYGYGLGDNVIIGSDACKYGASYRSVFIGARAGLYFGENSSYAIYGRDNTVVGYIALANANCIVGCYHNTVVGSQAMSDMGAQTGQVIYNVAIGSDALKSAGEARHNIAIGNGSLRSGPLNRNPTNYNIVIGKNRSGFELFWNGPDSVEITDILVIGHNSHGYDGFPGRSPYTTKHIVLGNDLSEISPTAARTNNVIIGHDATLGATDYNVGVGNDVSLTGSRGVALGHSCSASTDAVAIGYNISASSGQFKTNLFQTPASGTAVYQDGSGVLTKAVSSLRYKEEIQDLEPTLDKLEKLRPVRFKYKNNQKEDIGFIAEEMLETYPELVTFNNEQQVEGLTYPKITSILTKALQEAYDHIKNLDQRISLLENQ